VGHGTVTVANGGTIIFSSVDQSVALGIDSNSSGTLNINSGGTVVIGGADSLFRNSGSATINLAGGTLKIAGADFSTSIEMNLANLTVSTINTNGFSATLSGRVLGLGGLEKDGLGTLTLTNVETIGYNGTTNVTNGTLLLDGYDLDTTGDLTVAALTANSSANLVLQNESYLNVNTDVATNMTVGNTLGANDTVTVASNSHLYVGGTTIIGNAAGANSTMQVNGGSYFEADGALIIGNQTGANGTLTLSDPNSNIETEGLGLVVGEAGNGTLNVLNGGYLDLDGVDLNGVAINIGNQTGSNGTVLVSDAQSVLETGGYDAIVGNAGNGTLTIASGGVAQLEGNTTLGLQSTGDGVINLNAGGELDISPSGIQAGAGNYSFNLNGGALYAQSGNWTTAINFNLGGSTPSMIDTNNYNIDISGNLGGGGALDKTGVGALTLGGTNTYTGNTTVSTGELVVDGQLASTITVTGNQSVLGGNGTLGDVFLTNGGTIAPGIANPVNGGVVSGFSTLTIAGNLSWASDGLTPNVWHLNTGNIAMTGHQSNDGDLLTVVLNILYTGSPNTPIIFDFEDTGYFDGIDPADNTYTLIDSGNTLTNGGFSLAQFQAQNVGSNGQDTAFSYFIFGDGGKSLQFVVIPETATLSLWFGGAALLLGLYRKRARKSRAR
jgi:T5SS/PEP-CTERM-associated repeat protein/autotransporter-associated beta strand protein